MVKKYSRKAGKMESHERSQGQFIVIGERK
jgi:hypothetical protein